MIVDCAAYQGGKRVSGRLSIEEAREWLDEPGAFVWLGMRMPSHDELAETCALLHLDSVDVAEVLSPHRRAMVTRHGACTVLILRTALYDDVTEQVSVGEITTIVAHNVLITIRYGHASPLSEARKQMEEDPELLADGVTAAFTTVIRAVVESYRPALDGFEKDAVEVEREVLSESRQRPVRRLLNLSRQVRELHLAVEAMEDPLDELARNRTLGWTKQTINELRISISLVRRVVARTESLIELLTAANGANLAQVSAQQNDDMRRISAWVAIAAIPTMIAGIYGMNFENFPELKWRWGYPLVLGVMLTACALLYRSFKKRNWL